MIMKMVGRTNRVSLREHIHILYVLSHLKYMIKYFTILGSIRLKSFKFLVIKVEETVGPKIYPDRRGVFSPDLIQNEAFESLNYLPILSCI